MKSSTGRLSARSEQETDGGEVRRGGEGGRYGGEGSDGQERSRREDGDN